MFVPCALITLCALAAELTAAEPTLPKVGTQLTYHGEVALVQRNQQPGEPDKTFDLTLLVAEAGPNGVKLCWLVDEKGHGRWHWPDRFGMWQLGANGTPANESVGPALMFDYGAGVSPVPLPSPLLVTEQPLKEELSWSVEPYTFEVEKATKLEERNVWQILANDPFGRRKRWWIAQDEPLLIGAEEKVFMNMGTEYQLTMKLAEVKVLPAPETRTQVEAFTALVNLRQKLNRQPRSPRAEFAPEQLALLKQGFAAAHELADKSLLHGIAELIDADLEVQTKRETDLSALAKARVALPAPEFSLEDLAGNKVNLADLKGKTVVLHFWEYHDEPLQEPYGQVGYLDFLHHKRQEQGVVVLGVAVDSRLADGNQRSAALRSVRKLKSFMNLSYPILLDSGTVLKQYGDPRSLGAELPLFVVVAPDGKVSHLQTGFYKVDRDRGLTALDDAVVEAQKSAPKSDKPAGTDKPTGADKAPGAE